MVIYLTPQQGLQLRWDNQQKNLPMVKTVCINIETEIVTKEETVQKDSTNDNKSKERISETLDFKKHWNINWKKAHVEAAKMIEEMVKKNEQGIIIIAKNIYKTKHIKHDYNVNNENSLIALINNKNVEKRQFRDYWLYIIKKKLIVLNNITIDGNMYVINCEIECKKDINITTQLFITKDTIINQQLKQIILPIEWDTKLHHDIPLQLQNLNDKGEKYSDEGHFDEAVLYLQNALQICSSTFGPYHPYVGDLQNNLGIIYRKQGHYHKSIMWYEKGLEIRIQNFGRVNRVIADSYWNLGRIFEIAGNFTLSKYYFDMSWKIYTIVYGEWNIETCQAKRKVEEYLEIMIYKISHINFSQQVAINCSQHIQGKKNKIKLIL
ncbi:hypothetical protein RFI_17989 [Reticulomyxa filosa]|uniref:Uncharacterized protein n=1 Tax=Reticulomyxa filosa TaxID=46433 RepID=X6MYX5_RETFI|nr:hypothetical protein RFI_17989 [Reticulomyxa filosa]|eukprot:ETO19245.1 hypothetical protein RFI_17989 [Reticulomyxa filosa]